MKIGILTASRTNNIGTDLQALAMQWLFSSFGENAVELINYKCDKLENSRKIISKMNLHGILSAPYNLSKRKNHNKFRKKHFHYSHQVYDKSNISETNYDLIVAGSDQIWNQNITGNDLNFFLPFQNCGLKASYAASISNNNIDKLDEQGQLQKLLEGFADVSVREQSASKWLMQKGIEARFDLDPLLMTSTNQWDNIASHKSPNKGYVFVYVVDRVPKSVKFALEYAKKHQLDVYMWGNIIKPIKGVKPVRFKGIEEWISFMKNADFIVTNSYHGLSFAINYQKNFAIFHLKDRDSNARLENVLELSNINIQEDGSIYVPDWLEVQNSLDVHRSNSRTYIANLLERAEQNAK